jgi:hypothetical protein
MLITFKNITFIFVKMQSLENFSEPFISIGFQGRVLIDFHNHIIQ